MRRWTIAATSSSMWIQLCHWSPEPILPPRPNLKSGSCFLSAPPSADSTMPVRRNATRTPSPVAGAAAASHCFADLGEEAVPAGDVSSNVVVGAGAVEADRRAGQQDLRAVGRPRRSAFGDERGADRAALEDLALVVVGPALVADAGAGEVDDGVDAVEGAVVDAVLRRPTSRSRCRRAHVARRERPRGRRAFRRRERAVPMRPEAPVIAIRMRSEYDRLGQPGPLGRTRPCRAGSTRSDG